MAKKGIIKKILLILEPGDRLKLVGILFIILINSALELLGVSAVLPLITALTDPDSIDQKWYFVLVRDSIGISDHTKLIAFMALALALVYILKNLYVIWMNSVFYHFTTFTQKKMAVRLTECYLDQDYAFHVEHSLAELQRNIGNDVSNLFTTILNGLQLIAECLICLLLVVYLMFTDPATTMVVAVLMVCLMSVLLFITKKRMKRLGILNRDYFAARMRWFIQSFSGIKEIKTAGKEEFFLKAYDKAYDDYAKVFYKRNVLGNLSKPLVEMVCISGIMIYMAVRIMLGTQTEGLVPLLSVFAVAAFRMMPSFNRITGYVNNILFSKASVDAVYEDIREMEELRRKKKERVSEGEVTLKKELRVENIRFAYPSHPEKAVLDGVSIEIPYRSSVALVGASGSGKTTMADLILGIYTPQEGCIYADGKDIHRNLDSWHSRIGYIPQTIYLMDDTLKANVAFGVAKEEIDEGRVWEVLREAQLEEFVKQQPEGLDIQIGDRGVKLSGGQRQRIGIARALYTDPDMLVLDEATSALDTETETAVMDAIYRLSGKITMVIIAHRITTIRNCDRIYRIENGKASQISYEEAEHGGMPEGG